MRLTTDTDFESVRKLIFLIRYLLLKCSSLLSWINKNLALFSFPGIFLDYFCINCMSNLYLIHKVFEIRSFYTNVYWLCLILVNAKFETIYTVITVTKIPTIFLRLYSLYCTSTCLFYLGANLEKYSNNSASDMITLNSRLCILFIFCPEEI